MQLQEQTNRLARLSYWLSWRTSSIMHKKSIQHWGPGAVTRYYTDSNGLHLGCKCQCEWLPNFYHYRAWISMVEQWHRLALDFFCNKINFHSLVLLRPIAPSSSYYNWYFYWVANPLQRTELSIGKSEGLNNESRGIKKVHYGYN